MYGTEADPECTCQRPQTRHGIAAPLSLQVLHHGVVYVGSSGGPSAPAGRIAPEKISPARDKAFVPASDGARRDVEMPGHATVRSQVLQQEDDPAAQHDAVRGGRAPRLSDQPASGLFVQNET